MPGKDRTKEIEQKFNISLKELLMKMYWEQNKSQRDIAKELNVSTGFVCLKFKRYEINKRSFGYWKIGKKMSEEHKSTLRNLHKGKKMTLEQRKKISESRKGTPSHRKGAGLAERIRKETGKDLKGYLEGLYWEEGMSQKQICEKLNISTPYMARLFKRFKIEKRPRGYWLVGKAEVIDTVTIGTDIHKVTGKFRKKGYVVLIIKTHPFSSNQNGCVFEHRVKMEEHLGRYLTEKEIVHHINEIKDDNRIENLQVMDRGEHTRHHHEGSSLSDDAKKQIADKAKKRLSNKKLHPSYKNIDKELMELFKNGNTVSEIAEKLKVTRKTVYNKINYLNLKEI
ncbi:HNH endonuclease [Priestia flexa]|uniref:HNH endonuclease n=1 Tax=Priestia flexa TaxID=86664 RepID=UPI0004740042|nr:HNH endonuclease [Priestia flexa]